MKTHKTLIALLLVGATLSSPNTVFATDTVWRDVRSEQDYQADHMEGTEFIPHIQIGEEIGKLNLAKDTPIKLFCRSGGRSGIATETLKGMGYTNVENVGGIEDARKLLAASKAEQ